MRKRLCFFFALFGFAKLWSQQSDVKRSDYWRQHNIIAFNKMVSNPTYTFIGNPQTEIALWGRLQWTGVTNAPKNFLLTYSGKFGSNSGAGIGVFQSNNGLFVDTGLLVNYAYGIQLSQNMYLSFGANLAGLKSGIDSNKIVSPEEDLVLAAIEDDFGLLLMPGLQLQWGNFEVGVLSENLISYSFTHSHTDTDLANKIYRAHIGYKQQISDNNWGSPSSLYAQLYTKSIPDIDLRYGANFMYQLDKFGYVQVGYNSYYGMSGGLGVKVTDNILLGFTIETSLDVTQKAFGNTYEMQAVIALGKSNNKDKPISFKTGPQPVKFKKKNTATKSKASKEEIARSDKQERVKFISAEERDSLMREGELEYVDILTLDSLAFTRDSKEEDIEKLFPISNTNPRYKVVEKVAGVEYGFYLIANVFSQEYYFKTFMKLLKNRGLQPKWFFNKENEYYYVYLEKYHKLSDAERNRRSRFGDRYFDDTWILWVRKN
ncbi:MAG: PorP/SprF family type IX secretion system membrane protein [Flavobacteriaceae bacterium]|nr:PorP/SprF family type IX secretion system membrane protein [Flavobacteriaceae bacterium]